MGDVYDYAKVERRALLKWQIRHRADAVVGQLPPKGTWLSFVELAAEAKAGTDSQRGSNRDEHTRALRGYAEL